MKPFCLSRQQLLNDLYQAYYDARRHKRSRLYQQRFESDLDHNLADLCDELWQRKYQPRPSSCFIISEPKSREVFAAAFRDRIVHHLYYNYVHEMLERTFITDSYSCIKGRGTHYGVRRLEHHIRQESQNYQEPCYVMKMDVQGYFMHVNRQRLLQITLDSLNRMADHRVSRHRHEVWSDVVDMDFVRYLTREIILLDPTIDCQVRGEMSDWESLPATRSLFHSPAGCGLPIGNLTSQLFSNVYMNVFDQFMKRILHCRHYGRYVDDFYVVSADREWLHSLLSNVRQFLSEKLGLSLNEGKTILCNVRQGIDFLGIRLKPRRWLISHQTMQRMIGHIIQLRFEVSHLQDVSFCALRVRNSINSYLGVLSHCHIYRLFRNLFLGGILSFSRRYGWYRVDVKPKYIVYRDLLNHD